MTEAASMSPAQRAVTDAWVVWRLVTKRPKSLVRWFPITRSQSSMSKAMFCALTYISIGHNLVQFVLPPFEAAPVTHVLLMAVQIAGLIKMFMVNWRIEMENAA